MKNRVDEILHILPPGSDPDAPEGWYAIADDRGSFAYAKSESVAILVRDACRASNFV